MNLDLAGLRRKTAPGFVLDYDGANEVIQAVPDLLDRIKELEAERDVFETAARFWAHKTQEAEAALARVTEWADEQDYTKTPGNPESYSQWAEATDAARDVVLRLIEGDTDE